MMKKLKALLGSPRAMTIVDVLFILALCSRSGWLILLACLVWAMFLSYGARYEEDKNRKTVDRVLLCVALAAAVADIVVMLVR